MPLNIEGNNPNDVTLKALLMLLEVTMKIVQMLIGSMISKGTGTPLTTTKGNFNPIPKSSWNSAPSPPPPPPPPANS